jgi:hypothetical protein
VTWAYVVPEDDNFHNVGVVSAPDRNSNPLFLPRFCIKRRICMALLSREARTDPTVW